MKPMSDRKMDMNRGEPDSDGYFPDMPHHKPMPRAGEIRDIVYPDTEEKIHSEQQQAVKESNAARMKPGFRH